MQPEVIQPRFKDREEADPLVKRAASHFAEAKRTTIQFAADLSELQDREAHTHYGYTSFMDWAAATFDGLSRDSAKHLARCGRVVIVLIEEGRLSANRPSGVGTRALRELASIHGEYGREKMVEAYDIAANHPDSVDRDVNESQVKAAMRLLVTGTPSPQRTELEIPESLPEPDSDTDEIDDEPESQMQELIDMLRDLMYDDPLDVLAIREAVDRYERALKGEATPEDQRWLGSGR